MKNNIVTSPQLYFSLFLSAFAGLLFVNSQTSYIQIFYVILANVINFFVITFCKAKASSVLKIILSAYFLLVSLLVMNKFIVFMHSAIKSGPYWALLIIITITVLFCSRKGFEAFARAGVIISFFAVIFCIYILIATIPQIKHHFFEYKNTDNFLVALVMLFPSAVYASNKEKIKINKKTPLIIYLMSSSVILGYCLFLSSQVDKKFPLHFIGKISHIGVFKGAEFLFLTLITIGVIYFLLFSIESTTGGCRRFQGIVFLFLLSIFSAFCLYIESVGKVFNSQIVQIFASIIMIAGIIFNSIICNIRKNQKNDL